MQWKSIVMCLCHLYFDVIILAVNTDEAWYDSAVILESDCDEDFQSVPDGMLCDEDNSFQDISEFSFSSAYDYQ